MFTTDVCPIAIWRYARFARDRIFPRVSATNGKWIAETAALLQEDDVLEYCINADRYGRDKAGQILDVGERKYTELRASLKRTPSGVFSQSLLHRLRMCRRILLSACLVCDTGKKGGVAILHLEPETKLADFMQERQVFTLPGQTGLSFEIHSNPNVTLSAHRLAEIHRAASALTNHWMNFAEAYGVFPCSIDFLHSGSGFFALEGHYPSRGFEVLYAPFRQGLVKGQAPVEIFAGSLGKFTEFSGIQSILLVHNSTLNDDQFRPRSTFYGYEFASIETAIRERVTQSRIEVCNDSSQLRVEDGVIRFAGLQPDLVLVDDVDPLSPVTVRFPQRCLPDSAMLRVANDRLCFKRACSDLGIATPRWKCLARGEVIQFDKLAEELGELVVAKERFHLPSWHEKKRRGDFLDLTDEKDRQRMASWVSKKDLIVESILTDSIDGWGRCGELRIHTCGTYLSSAKQPNLTK